MSYSPQLTLPRRRFALGQVVATRSALSALNEAGVNPQTLVLQHAHCDWGDLCAEDRALNEEALIRGGRLLSNYSVTPDLTVWVITEADYRVTTILLPSDY